MIDVFVVDTGQRLVGVLVFLPFSRKRLLPGVIQRHIDATARAEEVTRVFGGAVALEWRAGDCHLAEDGAVVSESLQGYIGRVLC